MKKLIALMLVCSLGGVWTYLQFHGPKVPDGQEITAIIDQEAIVAENNEIEDQKEPSEKIIEDVQVLIEDPIQQKVLEGQSKKILEEKIITRYQEKTAAIRVEFENRVSILLEDAKEEYLALSPEERKNEKYNLAYKFMARAAELEKEWDKIFETILADMKKELLNHKLSTNSVKAAQQQYKEDKGTIRKGLMAKVMALSQADEQIMEEPDSKGAKHKE